MDTYADPYDALRTPAYPPDASLLVPEELLIPEEEAPLANRCKRFAARLLDVVLLVVAFLPGLLLMTTAETTAAGDAEGLAIGLGALLMGGGALGLLGYQIALLSREGQTVGKRALNLRVVDHRDGSNPGFARAVLVREVLTAALGAVPFFSFADALFIFGAERRCIHDHFAATKVVDETPAAVLSDAALI
jgi:uncharacterized RDD family membrane protein YckC